MSQQTILRVQTNIPETFEITGTTSLDVLTGSTAGYTGTGTSADPYLYSTSAPSSITMKYQANGAGSIFFTFESSNDVDPRFYADNHLEVYYYGQRTGLITYPISKQLFYGKTLSTIQYDVQDGDRLTLYYFCDSPPSGTVSGSTYFVPNTQSVNYTPNQYENLDLYSDIPIKINKSFAELQDIGKRNSDFSVNLTLPGSKKNNRFFETFYNVDMNLVFFDVTKRVPCDVLIEDQTYFRGYLKLNKINVKNSAVEYDVTLYSTVADIFGKIGNNLLRDLNFNDAEYHFNHQFHWKNIIGQYQLDPNLYNVDTPQSTFYPILHNGYNYDGDDVVLSGTTDNQTRLYTSSAPIGGYASEAAWISAGGKKWRINSPLDGIIDNQLKPALNIRNLVKLMFKGYGYSISSKFFETPWFRNLNMYGYFSSDTTKLSYIWEPGDCLPLSGVNVMIDNLNNNLYLVKAGTTTPVTCCETVTIVLEYDDEGYTYAYEEYEILPGEYSTPIIGQVGWILLGGYDTNANAFVYGIPSFDPTTTAGQYVPIIDNEVVDFSLMVDPKIKQIDFLSSLAKKFNLVFTPNPDVPNDIIIEPYDYYINSGDVHDWTEKLSYDQGFSVEPALNYIESTLKLTDLDDGDEGNKNFKDSFNRTYGEKIVFNTTDFKSSDKEIKTIFSPELIRTWDNNIGLPLGINYVGSTSEKDGGQIAYQYKGVKTKPKLFYWLGNFPPFADQLEEYYTLGDINTNLLRIAPTNRVSPLGAGSQQFGTVNAPIISHTSTIGNPDDNKINNDNLTVLFGSEQPVDLGVSTFPTYTDNNLYNTFYQNRIQNIYDKNTRFLSGKFNLKLSDILNLNPNDLIKIQEQYFTWNKIKEFNMTDPELTQVELIQTNRVVKTYPDRYFIYQYCDGGQYEYKFKTYFDYTEAQQPGGDRYLINGYSPAVMSNYFWATLYDYFVGVLGGDVSGYTSCVQDFSYGYLKYDIREVTQSEWESSSANLWNLDPARSSLWGYARSGPSWEVSGFDYPLYLSSGTLITSQVVLNVATGCTQMGSILTTLGITADTPYPPTTPLPVIPPTPTPTPTLNPYTTFTGEGSMILSYSGWDDESYVRIYVNEENTIDDDSWGYTRYDETRNLYTTYLNDDDYVYIYINNVDTTTNTITPSIYRRDYTNDDQGGNMGIVDTPISAYTLTVGFNFLRLEFQIEKNPDAYNFEYRLDLQPTPIIPVSGGCCTYRVTTTGVVYPLDAPGPEFSYVDAATGQVMFGETVIESDGKCFLYGQCDDPLKYWNDPYWGPLFLTKTRFPVGNGFCNLGEIVCQPDYTGTTVNAVCGSVTQLKGEVPIVVDYLGPCPTPTPTATVGPPTATPTHTPTPTPSPTPTLCAPIRDFNIELEYEATFATNYYSSQTININEIKSTIYSECYPNPDGYPTTYWTGVLSGFASPRYYEGTMSGSTQPLTLDVSAPIRQGMWAGVPQDIDINFLMWYTPQPGQSSLAINQRTYEVYVDDVLVQTYTDLSYNKNMSPVRRSFTSSYVDPYYIYGTDDFTITGVTLPTTDSVLKLKVIDYLIPDLAYPQSSPFPTASPTPTGTGPTPTPWYPTPTPPF